MERKNIKMVLCIIGLILLTISIILTFVSMANVNIIGGADWPTFFFIFFRMSDGLYSILAFLGILSIAISLFLKKGEN